MTDFSKNISNFFRSETKSFSEYKTILEENQIQLDWLNAVALYRKGVLALQKNDLSGIEEIKKANESLQKIVTTKNTEKAAVALKALTESLNLEITLETVKSNLDIIKYNFGQVYGICKKSGFSQIINENTFYEEDGDGSTDEMCEDDKSEIVPEIKTVTEETPVDNNADKSVEIAPNAVEPEVKTDTTDPTMPSQIEEKCGFEEGYESGKQWTAARESKFGCMNEMKHALNEKITSQLQEKPYSYVEQYKEGFKEGCVYQEKVHQRKFKEEWQKYSESQDQ